MITESDARHLIVLQQFPTRDIATFSQSERIEGIDESIFWTGNAGSGKSSQSRRLVARYKEMGREVAHISTGDRIKQSLEEKDKYYSLFSPDQGLVAQGGILASDAINKLYLDHKLEAVREGFNTDFVDGYKRRHDQHTYAERIRGEAEVQRHVVLATPFRLAPMRAAERAKEAIEAGVTPRSEDLDTSAILRRSREFRNGAMSIAQQIADNLEPNFQLKRIISKLIEGERPFDGVITARKGLDAMHIVYADQPIEEVHRLLWQAISEHPLESF